MLNKINFSLEKSNLLSSVSNKKNQENENCDNYVNIDVTYCLHPALALLCFLQGALTEVAVKHIDQCTETFLSNLVHKYIYIYIFYLRTRYDFSTT